MANTLFLLPTEWDICLDVAGNIAIATDEYQQAQDISSSCRVFLGDDYYSKDDGIPYLEEIMGKNSYPLALYQRNLHDRAMLVDGVVSVDVQFKEFQNRLLSGAIIFTNDKNLQGEVGL